MKYEETTYNTIDSSTINSIWVDNTNTSIYNGNIDGTLYDGVYMPNTGPSIDLMGVIEDLKEIKNRLLILERDVNMEEKYPELKAAKEEYERILKNLRAYEAITDGNVEK